MTRHERWSDYRIEIKNKSNIYEDTQKTDEILTNFKKRIIKINPTLIEDAKDEDGISFFSISNFSPSIEQLISIVDSYNYDFLNDLNNKILDMKMNIQRSNDNLITKDGKLFNEKYFLENSSDYSKIFSIDKEFNNLTANAEFSGDEKASKVTTIDEIIPNKSKDIVSKNDVQTNNKKSSFSKIYLVLTILMIISTIIVIIFVCLFETGHFN